MESRKNKKKILNFKVREARMSIIDFGPKKKKALYWDAE